MYGTVSYTHLDVYKRQCQEMASAFGSKRIGSSSCLSLIHIYRKAAIKYCIENAKKGDMIVLLGKGHEDYQEIKGVKYHFDEREAIAEIKKELNL